MKIYARYLIIILALFPSVCVAESKNPMLSVFKSGWSLVCKGALYHSYVERSSKLKNIINESDFTSIKDKNAKLKAMSETEFRIYMHKEIAKLAACHPALVSLSKILPGQNYLQPFSEALSGPSNVDRKVTYGVWAYNYFYRSMLEYQQQLDALLKRGIGLTTIEADRYKSVLTTIQNILAKLSRLNVSSRNTQLGIEIRNIIYDAAKNFGGDKDFSPLPSRPKADKRTRLEEDDNGSLTPSPGKGSDESPSQKEFPDGSFIPTKIAFLLLGNKLDVYQVGTAKLLFTGILGRSNWCFDRFSPDYPQSAKLVVTGQAEMLSSVILSQTDADLLKAKFQSAAGMQVNEGFFISDVEGVVINEHTSSGSLYQCINLIADDPHLDKNVLSKYRRVLDATKLDIQLDGSDWQDFILHISAISLVNDHPQLESQR
jgi:hypothetical protein